MTDLSLGFRKSQAVLGRLGSETGNLLVALLRYTRQNGQASAQEIRDNLRMTIARTREILSTFQEDSLLAVRGDSVQVTCEQRMRIATLAVEVGADIERVSRELNWREFEEISTDALKANSYEAIKHLVFSHMSARYEIDVLGVRKPLVVCIDCKHWRYGYGRRRIELAVERQTERLRAMCAEIFRLAKIPQVSRWDRAFALPVLVTLADLSPRIFNGTPIVSILRLRSFLQELDPYSDELNVMVIERPCA